MFGEASYAEVPFGSVAVAIGQTIIPEIGEETKQLVFVVEIDLIQVASSLVAPLYWSHSVQSEDIGGDWQDYMTIHYISVENIEDGTIATAPDGTPALRANVPEGESYGFNVITEQLVTRPIELRQAVTLRYRVYLDPAIDYTAILDGADTVGVLDMPGLVGGQQWPGMYDNAYPTNNEAMEGDNWSSRIRVTKSGKIGPYLYVQNKPGEFGWLRTSDHELRVNDLRGGWSIWEETCVMNTAGVADGRCILKINGETIVDVNDLEYRGSIFPEVGVNGMRLSAFVSPDVSELTFDVWLTDFLIEEFLG